MKTLRTTSGPFSERPVFKQAEIESTCDDALRELGLYPSKPQPVRIDRFVERRFGDPLYEDMPEGVLGYTRFGKKGVEAIIISRALAEEGSAVSERRVRTTLAHEAGHGLLHAHLFALGAVSGALFGEGKAEKTTRILCRDGAVAGVRGAGGGYDGRWWEFQANQAMAALLLPRTLVEECIQKILKSMGTFGNRVLPEARRAEAARVLVDIFEVNPVVARLRLEALYPAGSEAQLTL